MENKVVLGYWAIRGLAQRIRLILQYLAVPYEQELYEGHEARLKWLNQTKATLIGKNPAITLPYLKDGDKLISQSEAILIYLCHKANRLDLLGRDLDQKVLLATAYGVFKDVHPQVVRLCYGNYDENNTFENALTANRQTWKFYIRKLNGLLADKDFIAGGLTWVDFAITDFIQTLSLLDGLLLTDFPKLLEYQKRVWALPELSSYFSTGRFKERPCNNYSAYWK